MKNPPANTGDVRDAVLIPGLGRPSGEEIGYPLQYSWAKKLKAWFQTDTCRPMFTATLFTIAKSWEQPKCPPMGKWINKIWYIDALKYYTALKEGMWPDATKWEKLEDVMLSEISQP